MGGWVGGGGGDISAVEFLSFKDMQYYTKRYMHNLTKVMHDQFFLIMILWVQL